MSPPTAPKPIPAQLPAFNRASFTEDAPQVREGTEQFGHMFNNYNLWFAAGRQPAVAAIQSAPPSQIAYGYGYQPIQNISSDLFQFSQTYYPYMRFGLATALMNDGFSIFDFGDSGAPVNWWYDEWDFNLGEPLSPAAPASSGAGSNEVINGSFETNLANWSFNVNNDGQAGATIDRDATMAADGSASAMIHVAQIGTMQWHVDLEQDNLSLTAGTNYQVTFWARSDSPRSITVFSQGGAPNYSNYGLNYAASLTSTWQYFTTTFNASSTATDGQLEFWCGDKTGSIRIDGVTLTAVAGDIYRAITRTAPSSSKAQPPARPFP